MTDEPITATLLISCRDQRGLVAAVSDFLYRNNGNIIHADQHTDKEEGVFLQRVEWELDGFEVPREEIESTFKPIALHFGMQWSLHYSDYVPRVALFVSKLPHCLYDLLGRWRMGELRGEVPLIISNHEDHREIAETYGVNFHCLPVDEHNKTAQEHLALKLLEEWDVDAIVLARYMQVLSEDFVGRYPNRIINIHHSFLPAFAGARPYHQAYERGVKIIGATAHYVTAALDQGSIIDQDVARVSHRDSVTDLIRKGRDVERNVLARAVDLHLRNRVVVYGNKTVVFD
ncbi:MAG: formyltetrahydrofolate deformylase [Dehalococcoidia bacterium]